MMDTQTDARIGVFLCDCGEMLDKLLDYPRLMERAKGLEGVRYVTMEKFLCSKGSMDKLKDVVKEHDLDRLIIGACSPRIYLDDFRKAAEKAGINPYMVEMVNLREQVAWIHSLVHEDATVKALDALAMGVARAKTMRPKTLGAEAKVKEELCSGCGICASTCRLGAISMKAIDAEHKVAVVDQAECKACGACVAACPSGAMNMEDFSNEEIIAEIDEFSRGLLDSKEPFPAVLVFACHWCAYPAADLAGLKRLQVDPHFRLIRTPCSARVDPEWVLRALSRGVDGVLVLGGQERACHYQGGNVRTRNRMALLTKVLDQLGFDTDRFAVEWVNPDEPVGFKTIVNEFIVKIDALGPNPMRAPELEERMTSALYHPDQQPYVAR
jgi:coenzyme F420-reducing hydrogenase delta subunit/Pyruvate/2-oxoacid:ferredoxin oxidoreductase delta subunit